jgi:hypothetical protein
MALASAIVYLFRQYVKQVSKTILEQSVLIGRCNVLLAQLHKDRAEMKRELGALRRDLSDSTSICRQIQEMELRRAQQGGSGDGLAPGT